MGIPLGEADMPEKIRLGVLQRRTQRVEHRLHVGVRRRMRQDEERGRSRGLQGIDHLRER
jgi:hypothetical protein